MKFEIRNSKSQIPDSPLFCPAIWREDHFQLLDETLLPQATTYLTVRCVAEAVSAVRDMKTRAYGQVKQTLLASSARDLAAQLELEGEAISNMAATADGQEGIRAFLEKRKPSFKGD